MSFEDTLKGLGLISLEHWRDRGGSTEMLKIMRGLESIDPEICFTRRGYQGRHTR